MNSASVISVSKRLIGTDGGSLIEVEFREPLPSNSNVQCRFDTVLVFATTASFQNALCLSPPLPEGSINFSMLVNGQSLYEEVVLTVISSPVIHSVALNLSTTRSNMVSFLGSYPDSFDRYFTCHFNCNFE